ncbi:MAG: hypothetical protein ACRDUV_06865 [Pseudonocardiaceae bacterium]
MTERTRLEERLGKIDADLDQATSSFESAVETLAGLLGSKDTARITAAKDTMHLESETVRILGEEQRVIQHRLAHLITTELNQGAIRAVRSSSRAAWATFWIALIAMTLSTAAVVIAALTSSAR